MLDRVAQIERELGDVEMHLGDPDLIRDQPRFQAESRRYKELLELCEVGRALRDATENLEVAREMMGDATADEREQLRTEAGELEAEIDSRTHEFRLLLLPKDPNAARDVIVEIRGAEGGEEANLFARDLFQMYEAYAKRMGWKLEVLGTQVSDLGGFGEVSFVLRGDDVWTRMKHEGGPHRVQRVPVTESQGRTHTSSATVTVLAEADELDVDIDDNDLDVDYYRSSGPGGQSVNTTDSAVRITHRPTGITVSMQDQKSQLQNRAKAMQVLRARILQAETERLAAEESAARREQTGSGGRSEKIRTYNYKENRVSDHRVNLTIYKLDRVLQGELDEVSDALVHDEQQRQLERVDGA